MLNTHTIGKKYGRVAKDTRGESKKQRISGFVGEVREFNNESKKDLIGWVVENSPQRKGGSNTFLDIGCGRGGDLHKWKHTLQNHHSLIGFDVSSEAVNEAQRRAEDIGMSSLEFAQMFCCEMDVTSGEKTSHFFSARDTSIIGVVAMLSLNYMPNFRDWFIKISDVCEEGATLAFLFAENGAIKHLLKNEKTWCKRSGEEQVKIEASGSGGWNFNIVTQQGVTLVNDDEIALSADTLCESLAHMGWKVTSHDALCVNEKHSGWPFCSVYRSLRAVKTPKAKPDCCPFSFPCMSVLPFAARKLRSFTLNCIYGNQGVDHPLWRHNVLPAPQPRTLRDVHKQLVQSNPRNWWKSEKTDGVRALIVVDKDSQVVFDRSFNPWVVMETPEFLPPLPPNSIIVMDAEWVDSLKKFVVHDCVHLGDKRVAEYDFEVRMKAAQAACNLVKLAWKCVPKQFQRLSDVDEENWLENGVNETTSTLPPSDGTVLCRNDAPFMSSLAPKHTDVPSLLKHKNKTNSTVDFIAQNTSITWLTQPPKGFMWANLCLFQNDQAVCVDTTLIPSMELPKVVEMRVSAGTYEFVCERPDRKRPNTVTTAWHSLMCEK